MIDRVIGTRPRGWMSIARSQSFNTPRLLAEAGFVYMCDWVNDELPYRFATGAGDLVNVPLNHELSDRQIITVQQNSADSYARQMQDAHALLAGEAVRFGGRMRSEEHQSELQSLMRTSDAVFCLITKN